MEEIELEIVLDDQEIDVEVSLDQNIEMTPGTQLPDVAFGGDAFLP